MYRVSVLLKSGERRTKNYETKDGCETFILKLMDKFELKKSIIVNKNNIKERYIETFK